jgi:predicted nucleic acid-binding protein
MSVEFVDTNILVYAHEGGAGVKHDQAVELIARLFDEQAGAVSIQVLSEFYVTATKKLGMKSEEAEEAIADLGSWTIHRPGHGDVVRACSLHRRHKISWWDALIIHSASELGCDLLWSEDLAAGQRYGAVTVQNPFA